MLPFKFMHDFCENPSIIINQSLPYLCWQQTDSKSWPFLTFIGSSVVLPLTRVAVPVHFAAVLMQN